MQRREYPSANLKCAHGRMPDQYQDYLSVGTISSVVLSLPPLEDSERHITAEDTEVVHHQLKQDEGLLTFSIQGNITFNTVSLLFKGRAGGRAFDTSSLTKEALEESKARGFFDMREQVKLKLEFSDSDCLFLKRVVFLPKLRATVSKEGVVTALHLTAEILPAVFPTWDPALGFFGQHLKGDSK